MATSGCSYISKATDAVTGPSERVIPDTGMVPLGARRLPVLNPGGAMYSANADLESQKLAAENPYLNEGMKVIPGKASEYSATQPGWSGNVYHGEAAVQANGRRMPGENQAMMQSPPTVMAAPVEPMGAPLPPTAYNEMAPIVVPPAAAVNAPMPQPVPAPMPNSSVPMATMGQDGYPDLAATPVAPQVHAGNYQNNMNNLVAERELAENMRREMMQNPAVAEPGMPVAAPQYAAPAPAKTDAEFTGWLKNMFSEKDEANSVQAAASESYRRPIASAYVPPAAPEPQLQAQNLQNNNFQGGLEPIVLTPPPGAEPMQMASAAPMTSAPALEPITLSPPPEVASDAGMGNYGASEPITLQPPAAATNRNVRFLAEGRYASRRGANRMALAR